MAKRTRTRIRRPRDIVMIAGEAPRKLVDRLDKHIAWARANGAAGTTRASVMRQAIESALNEREEALRRSLTLAGTQPASARQVHERHVLWFTALGLQPLPLEQIEVMVPPVVESPRGDLAPAVREALERPDRSWIPGWGPVTDLADGTSVRMMRDGQTVCAKRNGSADTPWTLVQPWDGLPSGTLVYPQLVMFPWDSAESARAETRPIFRAVTPTGDVYGRQTVDDPWVKEAHEVVAPTAAKPAATATVPAVKKPAVRAKKRAKAPTR